MTPQEVITTWSELSGERFRIVPCIVQQQAAELAGAGFTREEMSW